MKLYLHIGIEKTGSSHLQSLCSLNRAALQKHGIWYPSAGKREDLIQKGEISAGNAQELTNQLQADASSKAKLFLKSRIEDAKTQNCNILLLSNELLLLALAEKYQLNQLNAILKQLNIESVEMLLVLRDPVDQALSLYKHRAKSGKILDIEEWPKQYYFYGEGLSNFLTDVKSYDFQLSLKKFKKTTGHLEELFFKEWLGLNITLQSPPKRVNPSLSLSELILLKKARQYNPQLVPVLYQKLIGMPKDSKAEDSAIELYYKASLSNHLKQFNTTWKLCNSFLAPEEALALPESSTRHIELSDKTCTFSQEQISILAQLMAESSTLKFMLTLKKNTLKSKLVKILKHLKLI